MKGGFIGLRVFLGGQSGINYFQNVSNKGLLWSVH